MSGRPNSVGDFGLEPGDRASREPGTVAERLTSRQRAALLLFDSEGELNEGLIADLWPLVRKARVVSNALVEKGLVTFGAYWDEEAGYELCLTYEGRRVLEALIRAPLPTDPEEEA